MNSVKDVYKAIVAEYVVPWAGEFGFKQTASDWFYRWNGDCLWRLSIGLRLVRGRQEGWLDVALCVGFRSLADFLKDCPATSILDVRKPCAMAADIGHLRPPHQLHEWRLFPDTNVEEVGAKVAREIHTHAMEYFERYGTLEQAFAAWKTGVRYNLGNSAEFYIAAVHWLRGEKTTARAWIQEKLEKCDDRIDRRRYEQFLAFLDTREQEERGRQGKSGTATD